MRRDFVGVDALVGVVGAVVLVLVVVEVVRE